MSEDLQNLLDRIQKDGVEKAEAVAARLLSDARAQADSIVARAKEEAATLRVSAEKDAAAFDERARKSLEQAARDVVLSVDEAVSETLKGLIRPTVGQALDATALKDMLAGLARTYFSGESARSGLELFVPPAQREEISAYFLTLLSEALQSGVDVRGDASIVRGFRVSVRGESVEHDFSEEAITEAICQLLRPDLAAIVRRARKR